MKAVVYQGPFTVSVEEVLACGSCRNCVEGWTSFCLRTNPTEA